jgi:serine protease inhibitor
MAKYQAQHTKVEFSEKVAKISEVINNWALKRTRRFLWAMPCTKDLALM